jgi:hypothetical protein
VITGSHLQLRSRDAPSTQIVSVHFDVENALPLTDVVNAPAAVRLALAASPHATAYSLNFTLPSFAWPGRWDVISCRLTDAAGNTVLLDEYRVAELSTGGVGGATATGSGCFRVENDNFTFHGDDLFDYGHPQDFYDSYDQFYTEYEEY